MNPKLKELLASMEELNAKETLSKEEDDKYRSLEAELTQTLEKVDAEKEKDSRVSRIADLKAKLDTPVNEPKKPETVSEKPESGFRSIGEFVQALRYNPNDHRLSTRDVNDQKMAEDTLGGYLVPNEYQAEIKMVAQEGTIVRPRSTVIPAGSAPDATVEMPVLNQEGTDGKGLYGGIDVTWISEGDEKPQKETAFKEVTLSPYEVAGSIVITDKLLRNAPAIEPLVNKLFRGALGSAEEDKFFNGTGSGQPTGYIGHASAETVNRATANRIGYADVVNMFVKRLSGGNYVWVASSSALAELMKMKDFEAADSDAPSLAWQTDARQGRPGTILGLPVLISDFVPTLGTKGDLTLCDFSYYLIKDGYGIAMKVDPYTLSKYNKTKIYAFNNVDGKPWLSTAITLRDGATKVSPFIVLDVPSTSS